jgi:hypothetical protein
MVNLLPAWRGGVQRCEIRESFDVLVRLVVDQYRVGIITAVNNAMACISDSSTIDICFMAKAVDKMRER